MPYLPKPKRSQRPAAKRKPTGRQREYITRNKWKQYSRHYRQLNPLCVVCLELGIAEDVTPGGYKGATDHVIQVTEGGALYDERNLMALGGTGSKCKHHELKSSLEGKGTFAALPYQLNDYGEKIPTEEARQIVIQELASRDNRTAQGGTFNP